jgi:hypothetical protein
VSLDIAMEKFVACELGTAASLGKEAYHVGLTGHIHGIVLCEKRQQEAPGSESGLNKESRC